MRTRAQMLRNAILLVVALVLINLIGQRYAFRLDLTADKRYSLSPATLKLLKALPEAVTVSAFFTERMPPDLAIARQDFKEMLVEYAARSNGRLVFEFIDPNAADSLEAKAQQAGIQPMMAQTREKDKAESMRVYMGCTVRMGDRKSTVPVIQQGSALEWVLSSTIKEVSLADKPVIGLVQGHGEPPPEALNQLIQGLSVMYEVSRMAIYDTVAINDRFDALMMIDPQDTIPPLQLDRLHDYLARGKGLVIAYSPVKSDLSSSPVVEMRHTGLEPWLERHGLRIEQRIVIDERCNQVQVMQQMGNFQLPVQIAFPFFPVISSFADHPVSSGLDAVVLQFCAPLVPVGDSTHHFSPLLLTSEHSDALASPQLVDVGRQWSAADFTRGPQVVGAEIESTFGGPESSHLIVFTNAGFCVNGTGQQPMALHEGNIDLMVNAADRATGSNDLLGLRGKEVNYRPIETLGDGARNGLKTMNLLLPMLFAITYGLARRAWRKAQRTRRMAPGYVR